jgi:hypothetical protein
MTGPDQSCPQAAEAAIAAIFKDVGKRVFIFLGQLLYIKGARALLRWL